MLALAMHDMHHVYFYEWGTMMNRLFNVTLSTAFIFSLIGSAAWAATANASYGSAWSSGSTLYVKDTKGDNKSVYAGYLRKGAKNEAYFYNYSGAGSTVSRNVGSTVTAVRICLNQWGPDTCSAWG